MPPSLAERHGSSPVIEISQVSADSPAANAGIHPGDLLVTIDGSRMTGVPDVQAAMEADAIDSRIVVTVLRDGLERQLVVVPRELES
jgi:S1-C subfamily serine protease